MVEGSVTEQHTQSDSIVISCNLPNGSSLLHQSVSTPFVPPTHLEFQMLSSAAAAV